MDQEVKQRWLDALRSGRYKQGLRKLCQRDNRGVEHFCCLGVLCEVLRVSYEAGTDGARYYGEERNGLLLPHEAQRAAELSGSPFVPVSAVQEVVDGYEFYNTYATVYLTHLNDDGVPFDKLADIIEKGL